MKKFFTIIAILLAFSTSPFAVPQPASANHPSPKSECKKPAWWYLVEAEDAYRATLSGFYNEKTNPPSSFFLQKAAAAALLYQTCSELEKNAVMTHPSYSAPLGPVHPYQSGPPRFDCLDSFILC